MFNEILLENNKFEDLMTGAWRVSMEGLQGLVDWGKGLYRWFNARIEEKTTASNEVALSDDASSSNCCLRK